MRKTKIKLMKIVHDFQAINLTYFSSTEIPKHIHSLNTKTYMHSYSSTPLFDFFLQIRMFILSIYLEHQMGLPKHAVLNKNPFQNEFDDINVTLPLMKAAIFLLLL